MNSFINDKCSFCPVSFNKPTTNGEIDMNKIIGFANNFRITNNALIADICLNIDPECSLSFSPSGIGDIDFLTHKVSNYTLTSLIAQPILTPKFIPSISNNDEKGYAMYGIIQNTFDKNDIALIKLEIKESIINYHGIEFDIGYRPELIIHDDNSILGQTSQGFIGFYNIENVVENTLDKIKIFDNLEDAELYYKLVTNKL